MDACAPHFGALKIHRVKNRNRVNEPRPRGTPLDFAEHRLRLLILPLEGNRISRKLCRAPKRLAVGNVVKQEHEAVRGEVVLRNLRFKTEHAVPQGIRGHGLVFDHLKALVAKPRKLRRAGVVEVDPLSLHQGEGVEVNAARRRHRGVQLAHRARAEVPRVLILCLCLRQFRIDARKIRVAHQGFAAEQKFPLERDAERHIAKSPHGSCHEFADVTVAARHRLIELTVPVAQHYREAVHLPRKQCLLRSEPGNQLVHALGLIEREHGLLMGYLGKRGQHFIADTLGRGAREHNAALLFEAL